MGSTSSGAGEGHRVHHPLDARRDVDAELHALLRETISRQAGTSVSPSSRQLLRQGHRRGGEHGHRRVEASLGKPRERSLAVGSGARDGQRVEHRVGDEFGCAPSREQRVCETAACPRARGRRRPGSTGRAGTPRYARARAAPDRERRGRRRSRTPAGTQESRTGDSGAATVRTRRTCAGRRQNRAHDPIGHLAREPERARPLHSEHDGNLLGRRRVEHDVAHDVKHSPSNVTRSPASRRRTIVHALAQPAQRRLERDRHLLVDPAGIAAPEAERDTSRREAGERGRLHREHGRMARVRVHDTEADADPLGGGRERRPRSRTRRD